MVVTLANVQADCGEVYDNLNNGTTAASSQISKAEDHIVLITGTTTGYDLAVRNLADAYICQQVLGSSSAANISVGSISVGRKQVLEMRDTFIRQAEHVLALSGYTMSVKNFLIRQVNG